MAEIREIASGLQFPEGPIAMVRAHPEQWIWMHKRWRTRPPGAPPVY